MVLAADGCFSTEFIALWIRTCGQRVQTETRAVKSDRVPLGERAVLQYHVRGEALL